MKRFKLNKRRDRRSFSRTSGKHPANSVKSVMRGGIRK